jgi:hypothetical protein
MAMKHAAVTAAVALTTTLLLASPAGAQQVYPTVPDWVSADTPVSTGGALVDLDRDGWLDLVVANGNDMAQQPLTVYYNQGDGTRPLTPDWQSATPPSTATSTSPTSTATAGRTWRWRCSASSRP